MDPDEQRRGGPRRAPVNRQGRGQPAPRRTAPGRTGAPRPRTPARRPQHPDRPAPPPQRMPYEDGESGYRNASGSVPRPRPGEGRAMPDHHGGGSDARDGRVDPRTGKAEQRGRKQKGRGRTPKQRGGRPERRDGGAEQRVGLAELPIGPSRDARGPRKTGRKRQASQGRKGRPAGYGPKLYFGAAAVLGLVVLLAIGAVVGLRGGDAAPAGGDASNVRIGKPARNGLSPVSYSNSPSTSAYTGIASRGADAKPLTIEESFPPSATTLSVPDGDVEVKLRAKRLDADCAAAIWGATVGDVLGKGGCTQAVRGIYSDTEKGYGLAVAVFNLAGSADADRFVATLEKTLGAGFVRPLEAPAPLDRFGHGFGMARGLAMGHFAVVTWAQRLDGKGDEKDETLLSLLIEGGKAPAVLGRAARTSN
ncbi:hypothetical protein E1287_25085 [Actinomadura sp. KC06]|uniref:hypothetical protein n=1 Tax=Actinomadura sp. KC06 TaxID=2530369 RepID=UPI0010493A94|nr:hypothetical protein [Actinomadura sp. KC06]TDD31808.1 hypothetical protein E1287_25085 [Actinomadura sp. KC06]